MRGVSVTFNESDLYKGNLDTPSSLRFVPLRFVALAGN